MTDSKPKWELPLKFRPGFLFQHLPPMHLIHWQIWDNMDIGHKIKKMWCTDFCWAWHNRQDIFNAAFIYGYNWIFRPELRSRSEIRSVAFKLMQSKIMPLIRIYIYLFLCVDPCLNNPCKFGGTCKISSTGYQCICPYGWKGSNCTG